MKAKEKPTIIIIITTKETITMKITIITKGIIITKTIEKQAKI